MRQLIASHSSKGVWSVRLAEGEQVESELRPPTTRHAMPLFRIEPNAVWTIELAMTRGSLGPGDRMQLCAFCDLCIRHPDREHILQVTDFSAWRTAVLRELATRGVRVRGLRRLTAAACFRLGVGAVGAIATLALTATRIARDRNDKLRDSRVVAAVHGERSNRTKHVIAALRSSAPDTPVLVLGRPRLPLDRVRKLMREDGLAMAPLARPYDMRALFGSLCTIPQLMVNGMRALNQHSGRTTTDDLARIVYRVLLGEASASWHRRAGPRSQVVVYGHTGLADTTLLELAQQRTGARTVHWLHGLTAGQHWAGLSSIGLFLCAHDARWYGHLGGYRRSVALGTAPPPFKGRGSGWLLLSNLVHPMSLAYQKNGVEGELRLLDLVAGAARQAAVEPKTVTWKPHPIYAFEQENVRRVVEEKIDELGFDRWPADLPLTEAAAFEVILSTPSTAALDVLRLGKLPILITEEKIEEGSAIGELPLIARSITEVVNAVRSSQQRGEVLFAEAWCRLGPGQALDLEQVLEIALSDASSGRHNDPILYGASPR
jgi:hypothetical protein